MRKEILKSKMMLIALASILFVSCGGGGGNGGLWRGFGRNRARS